MSDSESGDRNADTDAETGVVLDFLPHGRTEDDRPQYEKSPLAYLVTEESFRLLEVAVAGDADVGIGDRIDASNRSEGPV